MADCRWKERLGWRKEIQPTRSFDSSNKLLFWGLAAKILMPEIKLQDLPFSFTHYARLIKLTRSNLSCPMGKLLAQYASGTMYREPEEDIYDQEFMEVLENTCSYKLYLDFYGCSVCVRSQSRAMHLEFEFIFEMFCIAPRSGEDYIEFFFSIERHSNKTIEHQKQLEELTWTIANYCHDNLVKTVYRRMNNKLTRLQKYDKWPTDEMVIPPFNIEPLRNKLLVIEGNALISNKGKVCLIVGGWWQGKTTLTAILLKMGYSFLSDGLIVIDRQTRKVKPYSTLCAFRYYNIPELGDLGKAIVKHPKTIQVESPNTGLIYLNHFSSFFSSTVSESGSPSFIAICKKSENMTNLKASDVKDFMLETWQCRTECGLDRNEFFQDLLSLYETTQCSTLTYSNLSDGALMLDNYFTENLPNS